MSGSSEVVRVRQRQPVEDRMSFRKKDTSSIGAFLEQDQRWRELASAPHMQSHVRATLEELHSMTPGSIVQRAKALDQEIPLSSYLRTLAQNNGTLMEQHASIAEIFDRPEIQDEEHFGRLPARIVQIRLAEWLIGRKIEENYTWAPDGKGSGSFLDITNVSQNAISLCIDAITEVDPPNI